MRENDNKLTKFTAVMLLITLLAVLLVSGTYAKYTTKITGNDTATVAKFKVGSNLTDTTGTSTFDLFPTATKKVDGVTDNAAVADDRIAPGTGGKFDVELTNESEVNVQYTLTLKETSNSDNIPIEYSIDGTTYVKAADFTISDKLNIPQTPATTSTSKTVTVYWRWAFTGSESTNYKLDQTDSSDTTLGQKATQPTITVEASAVFDQVQE